MAAKAVYDEKEISKGFRINEQGEFINRYTVETWREHNKIQEVDKDFEIDEIYEDRYEDAGCYKYLSGDSSKDNSIFLQPNQPVST